MSKEESSLKIKEPSGRFEIGIWNFEFVLPFVLGTWSFKQIILTIYHNLPPHYPLH